jgi:hypothetical protein
MAVLIPIHEGHEEVFLCDCGGLDHSLYMVHYPGDAETYIHLMLDNWRSLFARVKVAVAYIYGNEPTESLFNQPSFRVKDADRLIALLNKQIGNTETNHKKGSSVVIVPSSAEQYELRFIFRGNCYENGDISPELTAEVFLKQGTGCLRRLRWAIQYITGIGGNFNKTVEFVLFPEVAEHLRALVELHKQIVFSQESTCQK